MWEPLLLWRCQAECGEEIVYRFAIAEHVPGRGGVNQLRE